MVYFRFLWNIWFVRKETLIKKSSLIFLDQMHSNIIYNLSYCWKNIIFIFRRDIFNVTTFQRQSRKRFSFRVKLSDSIFFLLGLSPIVKLI